MSDNKNIDSHFEKDQVDVDIVDIAESPDGVSSVIGSVKNTKQLASSSERQIKFERAQKCLENAALVSKRIKEHRKATAELLGKPFDDDAGDTASEMATTISERTGYSVATEKSTLSVQDALNIPGISESLANTLKQKELLMERIKQYKEISKRPPPKTTAPKKDSTNISTFATAEVKKQITDNANVAKLMSTVKEKENALSVMQVKIRAMETTILDLQEKINEKDQIIKAKNMATTLISDNLSKKEKDSMHLLEDTRQQMTRMQQNFAAMESEWKEEKNRLLNQIGEKTDKINSLQEANTILENSRFEIGLAYSKLAEELELKNKNIIQLEEKIEALSKTNLQESPEKDKVTVHVEEEKGTLEIAEMVELTKKIEILEHLNFQIRQTNKDLENQLAAVNSESKVPASSSSSKKGSPISNRKGARNTKTKSPWSNLSSESTQEPEKKIAKNDNAKLEMMLQSLNKDIIEKEYIISQKELLISQLESTMTEKDTTIDGLRSLLKSQNKSTPDMVNIGTDNIDLTQSEPSSMQVLNSNTFSESSSTLLDVKDLEQKLKIAQDQIVSLNEEIDAANKNMVKVKSHSKLKMKQLQRTIDSFSKVSDANAEIVKLNEELHQLSQKVAELEEEKGNLQLHLVDYDSGRLTESDVYKKLVEIENLAEARLKSISVLETQKFDLVQELHVLQQKNIELEDKLADISQLQNEQVCSEIKSVQLEEQIDELFASKKELELVIDNLKLDREQSFGTIRMLQGEKDELIHKLENYIQENMDLTDKLEKLSAEKVSSAESIEIVESLTTQEKLELEEYNKGLDNETISGDNMHEEYKSELHKCDENIEILVKQSAELNEKVELFTNERQEVMDKMNTITLENESLHDKIMELNRLCESLRGNIDLLTEEKTNLLSLNHDLSQQIEELKNERLEIMKETVEIVKPLNLDENLDNLLTESHDEKSAGDKINIRSKSVKQLTKEILKLKNTIKEREAEIADCQMKILSLEEHQEKQREIIQNSAPYEEKIKQLIDENSQLKYEIEKATESEHERAQMNEEHLQEGILKLRQEYSAAINARDTRIHELENLLKEYEMQILNYVNTLQQKDKEISEYVNQITKLNDVSQKLKSTVELLEEEKTKDQNMELIKSLNKQISIYQKTLSEYEDKLKILDEEKSQLASLKSMFENKSNTLESEIKNMEGVITEKETLINELKMQHQKHLDELSTVKVQAKEQDEEIHEIKLQLRRESIENEKLRTLLQQKDIELENLAKGYENVKANLDTSSIDHKNISEQYVAMEQRNKELMEKLKKFAITIKKKSAMYIDLESQFKELEKETESKNQQLQNLRIQVESIPTLQEQFKQTEEQNKLIENDKAKMGEEIKKLQDEHSEKLQEIIKLNQSLDIFNKELYIMKEENGNLKTQNDYYSKKIAECEIDQKNNSNFLTKISCLEADINQKHSYIEELSNELKNQEDKLNQIQTFHGAKVQESELYIENLQSEIDKNKNRIARLEETVSMMEDSRISFERRANQLDNQLQEKQQAYKQYSDQEDELVSRLAYLMDNDRQILKQLYETDMENQELQFKIQYLNDENSELQNTYSDLQDYCKVLELKANKVEAVEADIATHESRVRDLEAAVKRLTAENHALTEKRKIEMEELESEFNTQIETAIKEKKVLSENYEKLCEREEQLKLQLQEYHTNLENLRMDIKDLSTENQKLVEISTIDKIESVPDYTDQYISEINDLNSVINGKNEEIIEISNKMQILQTNHALVLTNLEHQISDLANKLQHSSLQNSKYILEIDSLNLNNEELIAKLQHKEDQIKQLMEKKKLFFEMNIPKTEGLTISSTIEDVYDYQKDVAELKSQIVTDADVDCIDSKPEVKKTTEQLQLHQHPQESISVEGIVEPPMVSKNSYLCYNKDEIVVDEFDPFNSEEGWGVDTNEESVDFTPGLSHLNHKIQKLNEDNQQLKIDLENTNIKLKKAVKKLKELKASNDILSNELNISKQISQTSMLDMAIESEMSNNLEELEKRIQALNMDVAKEKREKEALKKQNEVFKNANDRLLEMKEKMDNEVELWKYNFKQANDKVSSLQWGTETKENTNLPSTSSICSMKHVEPNDDMIKLEKENDELQAMVDNLNLQNHNLSKQLIQLKDEFHKLEKESKNIPVVCEQCEKYKLQLQDLLDSNTDLNKSNITLSTQFQGFKSQIEEGVKTLDEHKARDIENKNIFEDIKKDLLDQISCLQETIESQKKSEFDANNRVASLIDELEHVKTRLVFAEVQHNSPKDPEMNITEALEEKNRNLEAQFSKLETTLQNANEKIKIMETENYELVQKTKENEEEINVFNTKLQHLNVENDQLLSTVAELRASVSSAVDQRGYEIAELWKQHLMQREGEFKKNEQDLRTQLSAAESKYEQLLDKMQSSNSEETEKIIMVEQFTSLQNKIQEKEENLISLQSKYADVMRQLEILRLEMEDEKLLHENKMLAQQEEYEKIVNDLNLRIKTNSEDFENAAKTKESELTSVVLKNDNINQQMAEIRSSYEIKIGNLTKQIQEKDSEIYQKTQEFTTILAQKTEEFEFVRLKLLEYEKKIEDLGFEKESELAVLRLKMHDSADNYERNKNKLENEKKNLAEALNNKIVECTNLNKIITDLKKSLEEYSVKTAEAQAVLENQEIEIVALKEEISDLNDMVRSSSSKIDKHVTFSSNTKAGFGREGIESSLHKDLLDAVPRAELDLALYMLHQRDVRCEELTMELTQLLEERDTLQLRLSDSLRSVEEFKLKSNSGLNMPGQDILSESSTSSETVHQFVDTQRPETSRSRSLSDPDAEKPKLQAKLSELRSVKHSRDVRLRHDSEQRQLGMRLLHRDVANLPPEAIDQLAQAHHTLTRDSQSTPTVLLNWLRGKSTPKVVHM